MDFRSGTTYGRPVLVLNLPQMTSMSFDLTKHTNFQHTIREESHNRNVQTLAVEGFQSMGVPVFSTGAVAIVAIEQE